VRLDPPAPRLERERARKLLARAETLRERPFEGAAPDGTEPEALASQALTDPLQGREAAALEALEQALSLAADRASVAFHAQEGWVDAVRAGLLALLEFFDEEPELARYLVVHSAQAGGAVLERRSEVLDRIAVVLDDERAPARSYPPPLTALAVASGVLGVLHEHLARSQPGPLVELAGSLMSLVVLPFLGARAARRELAGAPGARGPADLEVLKDTAGRVSSRASLLLGVIAAEPGLNSRQLAARAGIHDEGQSSRLTARLQRLGLIENARDPGRRFAPNAWRLTAAGERLQEAVGRDALTPDPVSAFDLPGEFRGRLDDLAVLILRAIGDQPWLRSAEVAERAGVEDRTEAARLLARLEDLGLALGEREAHQRGTPKAWRLTPAGEQLDREIGRETAAPPRSAALDLMWESGGRLTDTAISVLRAIGAEPGLSNNDLAARVGITDENTASQLLVRLSRRELVENTRTGGRYNVWRLTSSGEQLERAIWDETPEHERRSLALGLLRDRGGRLNHRVVSVLKVIGAQPELSNNEIAQRVGIEAKGHTSTLLARLARFGLIENLVRDPLRFEPNAWQLSRSGVELANAITGDAKTVATRKSRQARR
jgi:DNA-binding IclR family transcriptional regulator